MKTSRRQAIKLAVSATAALGTIEGLCGQVARAAQEAAPAAADRGWLRRDQFEACRGEMVIVHTSSRSITLWLMAVDDVPSAHYTGAVADQSSFVVLFQGPDSPKLAQGTYQVESRTSLSGGNWTVLYSFPGDNQPRAFTNGTAINASSFFRIRAQ